MTAPPPPSDPGPAALADDRALADRLFGGAAVIGLAAYLPLLFASFAWDDAVLLPALADRPWSGLLTRSLWPEGHGAANGLAYWRPMQELEFKGSLAAFGLAPGPLHAVSLLAHLLVSALLYRWLRARGGGVGAAVAAAAFLLHPAHQEAVSWIAARNDLWAALAVVVAGLLWGGRAWGLAPLAVLVGMGFKEVAVVALPLLLGLDLVRGALRPRALALLGVVPAYAALRALAGQPFPGGGHLSVAGLATWPVHAAAVTAGFRAATVHQPLSLVWSVPSWCWGGVGSLLVLGVALGRQRAGWVGLAAWFAAGCLALEPALAMDSFGDRYLYVAGVGLAVAGSEASRGWRPGPRAVGVAGLALLALGAWCASTVTRWADDEALWSSAATTDLTGYSSYMLGEARLRVDDPAAAEAAFRAALGAPYPDPEAAEPLGLLLLLRGETGEGCALLGAAPRPLSARGEALLARCASAP